MHGFYVSCMYLICFLELDKNGMGECEDLWWSDDQSLLTSHPGTIKTTIINGAWLRWWPNLWALGAPPNISVFSSADKCICILYTECKVYFELAIWGQAKWTLGHIFIHHSKPPVAFFLAVLVYIMGHYEFYPPYIMAKCFTSPSRDFYFFGDAQRLAIALNLLFGINIICKWFSSTFCLV